MFPYEKEEPSSSPERSPAVPPPDIDELIFGGDAAQRHSER